MTKALAVAPEAPDACDRVSGWGEHRQRWAVLR